MWVFVSMCVSEDTRSLQSEQLNFNAVHKLLKCITMQYRQT